LSTSGNITTSTSNAVDIITNKPNGNDKYNDASKKICQLIYAKGRNTNFERRI